MDWLRGMRISRVAIEVFLVLEAVLVV